MKTQYPNVQILEVLKAYSGYPQSASACRGWVYTNQLVHPVLRDDGKVQSALAMSTYDAVVLDRNLKVVLRASIYSSSGKQQLLTALSGLK